MQNFKFWFIHVKPFIRHIVLLGFSGQIDFQTNIFEKYN